MSSNGFQSPNLDEKRSNSLAFPLEYISLHSVILQEPGIMMHEGLSYHSLLFQVCLVSNQHHGEVISVLHPQDLGVELLDLMVAVGRIE